MQSSVSLKIFLQRNMNMLNLNLIRQNKLLGNIGPQGKVKKCKDFMLWMKAITNVTIFFCQRDFVEYFKISLLHNHSH